MNLLIYAPLSLENGRGGEISSIELATGLNKYFDVTLIDTNRLPEKALLSRNKILRDLRDLNVVKRIYFATIHTSGRMFSFPYPWELIKLLRFIKDSHIVYLSISTIKMTLFFLFSSLFFRNTKFIIGYRKPLYLEKFVSLYNLKYRINILLVSLFRKRIYHHTISRKAKRFLERFIPPNRIHHIIHGVNLNNFKGSTRKKHKFKLKFLYSGYLDDVHKGVGVLLEAIEEICKKGDKLPFKFEFCGTGPLEGKVENLEKRFSDKVQFNGYIDKEFIPQYYRKSDVFLFTSRKEPFGRVIIEALAAKLIIICTKTIGSLEILKGRDFAFFIEKLTPQELIQKILVVYRLWKERPERFKELRIKAENHSKNYSLSEELIQFKNLIYEIKDI